MDDFSDFTCTACGCVCDDLRLTVRDGSVAAADCRGCPLAEQWFDRLITAQRAPTPVATIGGQSVTLATALDHAAEILRASHAPLIYGLSRSSTPGQRAAVELADRVGAIIDTTASVCHGPSIMAIQSVGESTSTLGEIKQRADLVVFWGADPMKTHPRHLERYSAHPRSQFLPNGRCDRTLVVVDTHETQTAAVADVFIRVNPGEDFELITALRMLIKELSRNATVRSEVVPQSGSGLDERVRRLADLMRGCRYGVVFFGLGIAQQSLGHLTVEALLRLVAELNATTRFTARRLRIPGDVSGADAVLCWQTGFPFAVSLQRSAPRYNPGEFSISELLQRGDVDSCVIVGSESLKDVPLSAQRRLAELPTIVLDHAHQSTTCRTDVRFTTSVYGLHDRGTAYRMDEVPLALRAVVPSDYPSDEDVLGGLRARV